jgi:tRNA threonylcarbamoyladenosine biosynthesis protein TsaB
MLLLAADTSGKHGSIALSRCGPDVCVPFEVVPLDGGTFSAELVPKVAALLARHGLGKRDMAGFAVVSGPGSFTGLRVGLAAMKALAEVFAKPLAAVSLLEAMAVSGRSQGKVIAALDAGRGDIYAGQYCVNSSEAHLESERLLTRSELIRLAVGRIVLTADHALAEEARGAALQVEEIELPRADTIASMGWKKILTGRTVLPGELDANYIRRSSEIFSKSSS